MRLAEFASKELFKPLLKALRQAQKKRQQELRALGNEFMDPIELANYYVEPECQHYNPADHDEDREIRSGLRLPVFQVLNDFFDQEGGLLTGGHNQHFVLADAGMGKTALLLMLKLFHWNHMWPVKLNCELLKLNPDSLERIDAVADRANTVLLLDSLDEDPVAWGRLEERLLAILDETKNFRRVIISCRTQFFPEGEEDPFARLGKLELGGYVCPMIYLSPFSNRLVDRYLAKRFPRTVPDFLRRRINPKHEQARGVLSNMRSLRMRPFLLANIQHLMTEERKTWNLFTVYEALVNDWLNREEAKLREQARKRRIRTQRLPTRVELLDACKTVALAMHRRRIRVLSQFEFRTLIEQIPEAELVDELEHGSSSLMNKTSEGAFRFSHYSIQEFLVVLSQLEGPSDYAEDALDAYSDEMCRFLSFGLNVDTPSTSAQLVDFHNGLMAEVFEDRAEVLWPYKVDVDPSPIQRFTTPGGDVCMGDLRGFIEAVRASYRGRRMLDIVEWELDGEKALIEEAVKAELLAAIRELCARRHNPVPSEARVLIVHKKGQEGRFLGRESVFEIIFEQSRRGRLRQALMSRGATLAARGENPVP